MNLLFIDDEEESRKGIEKYTNWGKLGIDNVISFSNPFTALEYIEKERVDIVLSDIRMPRMDGIQLCKNILEKAPSISIIFVSGYSDKEYLMNAIQMSAIDYIEKPVNVPKLEAAIEKAVNRQLHNRSLKQSLATAMDIVQKNRQLYIDQLAGDLIHGKQFASNQTLAEADSELIPLNHNDFYRVYLWKVRKFITGFQNVIQNMGAQLSGEGLMPSFIIARKDEQNFLFIARFSSPLECNSYKTDHLMVKFLRWEHMEDSVFCSYGRLLQGFRNISESYNQAVIAQQNLFFLGYGAISPYQDTCIKTSGELPRDMLSFMQALQECLRQQDKEKCRGYLEEVYRFWRSHTDILPDIIRNEYFKIISAINQNALELTERNRQSDHCQTEYLWQCINSLETLEECHRYAQNKADQFFHNLGKMASERKIILDVIRIIRKSYSNCELGINQIAEQVYMTPNYLSTLFKKETGKTIGGYITAIRLEKSIYLLTHTNMKLYDIAQSIGYTDTNYYSKLFKKYYHMTPSEYRNRYWEI